MMTGRRVAAPKARSACAAALMALLVAGCGKPSAAAPPAPVHGPLSLNPASGPPGTVVTIHGYLAGMRTATAAHGKSAAFGGEIAFGGFADGLSISADQVIWSRTDPGHFTTTFTVPLTNWLTPNGTAVLAPGAYRVVLRCFGVLVRGCAAGPDQLSAAFTVTGAVKSAPAAAYLSFSPPSAAPGQLVHVTGWAPLTNVIGQPFGYNLVWGSTSTQIASISQSLTGRLSGSFRVPAYVGSGPTPPGTVTLSLSYMFLPGKAITKSAGTKGPNPVVTLAPTPFRVVSGLRWAALDAVPVRQSATPSPIWVFPGGGKVLLAGPAGSLMAGPPGALVPVSLRGIQALAQSHGYPVLSGGMVSSVRGVAAFPQSLFITAATESGAFGSAPPVFWSPFVSTDGGTTWQAIPVPSGMTYGDFAGFRTVGRSVYALWTSAQGGATAVEVTTDGGRSWSLGSPPCPATGACLMLGPGPTEVAGMGSPLLQDVWRQNRQHRWVTSAQAGINISTLQLSALSNGAALLVDSQEPYPVEVSTDGGRTWESVAVPNPPDAAGVAVSPYANLLLLPNGALLGSVPGPTGADAWYVLPAGQSRWRAVPSAVLPPNATGLTIADGKLWWYDLPTSAGQTVTKVQEVLPGSL